METRTRPTFDEYYCGIAREVASRGDCRRAQHGCVIVKGHRIVSAGYNGTPPGDPKSCLQGDCPRALLDYDQLPAGSSYDTGPGACISTHSEANALLRADWDSLQGATCYVTAQPCDGCRKLIRSAGIKAIVYPEVPGYLVTVKP